MPSEKATSSFLSFYLKHPACECVVSLKKARAKTQSHEHPTAGNWPQINLFLPQSFVSTSINCRFPSC